MSENDLQLKKLEDREKDIGIHCSIIDLIFSDEGKTNLPKPVVSLKTLYSDFVVREFSPFYNEGQPLKLEDLDALRDSDRFDEDSSPNRENSRKRVRDDDEENDSSSSAQLYIELKAEMADLAATKDIEGLIEMLETGAEEIVFSEDVTDKVKRTQIHQVVRKLLGGSRTSAKYISGTEGGKLKISKASSKDAREDKRRSNPIRTRPYLHFTLYKENFENNQAINFISKHLGVATKGLQFCGSKDKRAVTLQRMCVQDLDPDKLKRVNTLSCGVNHRVKVCGLQTLNHGLALGDALGNRFEIVLRLRDAQIPENRAFHDSAYWSEVVNIISTRGAINYFGPQRFGTTKILTSDIGLLLLRLRYEEAIELLFEAKSSFVPDLCNVLPLLKGKKYEEALQLTPHFCYDERSMLRQLARDPNDYLAAFLALPRTLAMLYFHSVQSLIWNCAASKRLLSSRNVEAGDMVFKKVYDDRMKGILDSLNAPNTENGKELDQVCILKEEELTKFSLKDVVLPIPGPDAELQFPQSPFSSKEAYIQIMRDLNIPLYLLTSSDEEGESKEDALNAKKMNSLVKAFHFHGGYRPLMVVPKDLTIDTSTFKGWRTTILPTDLEQQEKGANAQIDVDPLDEKEYGALITRFSLPPGCYATCVLREFSRSLGENFHS